jgi:hypothetical protein
MEMENSFGLTDLFFREISKMMKSKGKDFLFGQIKNHMMEIGITIK